MKWENGNKNDLNRMILYQKKIQGFYMKIILTRIRYVVFKKLKLRSQ